MFNKNVIQQNILQKVSISNELLVPENNSETYKKKISLTEIFTSLHGAISKMRKMCFWDPLDHLSIYLWISDAFVIDHQV